MARRSGRVFLGHTTASRAKGKTMQTQTAEFSGSDSGGRSAEIPAAARRNHSPVAARVVENAPPHFSQPTFPAQSIRPAPLALTVVSGRDWSGVWKLGAVHT